MLNRFHSFNLNQTGGTNSFQLSATGGSLHKIVVVSGSASGFVNFYDAANGLPMNPAGERVLASGVTVASGDHSFEVELNAGLFVVATGAMQAVVTWN